MKEKWEPTGRDLQEVYKVSNPWWAAGDVPGELAPPHRRALAGPLARAALSGKLHRYQLILGPRRVGKTTVMYQVIAELLRAGVAPRRIGFLSLDHPLLQQRELGSLIDDLIRRSAASPQSPAFIFLDELVYAERWSQWLKTFFDQKYPIRIMASSSSTAGLRDGLVESGVGRWEEQYLPPWQFLEYLQLVGEAPSGLTADARLCDTIRRLVEDRPVLPPIGDRLRRFLIVGGFPELLTIATSDGEVALGRARRLLRADAVERAIYRDLPQAVGITQPLRLEKLLYLLAGQAGGIVSPTNLSVAVGISAPTVDEYVAHLERAFLVFMLPPYSGSEERVQRRGRKVYFVDAAIRNAALQRGALPLTDPGELALLYENAVASHLHALAQGSGHRLYYWRRGDAHEVDALYGDPVSPLAFEVASSARHHRKGLSRLQETHPEFAGRSYLVTPESLPLAPPASGPGAGVIPFDLFFLGVGLQLERAVAESFLM